MCALVGGTAELVDNYLSSGIAASGSPASRVVYASGRVAPRQASTRAMLCEARIGVRCSGQWPESRKDRACKAHRHEAAARMGYPESGAARPGHRPGYIGEGYGIPTVEALDSIRVAGEDRSDPARSVYRRKRWPLDRSVRAARSPPRTPSCFCIPAHAGALHGQLRRNVPFASVVATEGEAGGGSRIQLLTLAVRAASSRLPSSS